MYKCRILRTYIQKEEKKWSKLKSSGFIAKVDENIKGQNVRILVL